MSDERQWKGGRVGPYELGRRLEEVPEEEGQLYEARHVETGEPALAVVPGKGEDWRLTNSWEVRTASFTPPGMLLLHPTRWAGAKAPNFHELSRGSMRLAGTLAFLAGREDARALFTRPPRASRRTGRWGLAGAGLALVAGLALLLWPRAPERMEMDDSSAESLSFADRQDPLSGGIAYPMPEKPFKEQSKPPCTEREEEVRGGCWIPHAKTAPCPRGTAEFEGKCYVPVKKPDPAPTSVHP